MIVSLIGRDKKYKIELPQEIEGSYWIVNEENGKKLVNIEGNIKNWQINSNRYVKIINPNSVKMVKGKLRVISSEYSVVSKITLKEHGMYFICFENSDDIYVLYCSPSFEDELLHFEMTGRYSILIGRNDSQDIMYSTPLISESHAQIFVQNNKLMIKNFNKSYGTYVNDKQIYEEPTYLKNGDIIFILGLKIIVVGKQLYISGPLNKVKFYYRSLKEIKNNNQTFLLNDNENDDENIELYNEDEYFANSPRIVDKIVPEECVIDKPPNKQEKSDSTQLILTLGTSLSMSIVSIITLINAIDRITEDMSTKKIMLTVATPIAMLISMLLLPIIRQIVTKTNKSKREQKRRIRYKKYINDKIKEINQIMDKQKETLHYAYPSADECEKIIDDKSIRLWERKINDFDFMKVKLGNGNIPLKIQIKSENKSFQMEDDELLDIYYDTTNQARILKDAPVSFSMIENNILAIICKDNEKRILYMKNIIMQLIAMQSYTNLKLVFLLNDKTSLDFQFAKMLPHVWDDRHEIRFFGDNEKDIKDISDYLGKEIHERKNQDDGRFFSKRASEDNYKRFETYFFIITDDYRNIENLRLIKEIINTDQNYGATLCCMSDNITQLPNECKTFIELNKDLGKVYEDEKLPDNQTVFSIDELHNYNFQKVSRILGNVPIKIDNTKNQILVDKLNFLEMYNVGNIEQLNILDRWKKSDSVTSLQAEIGIDENKSKIYLDAHEKYHGPHGLIAGTTGSGKSEFIITYILSLAINYNPDDVTFVLIDYKGGGLAGAFKKKNIQLPHLVRNYN